MNTTDLFRIDWSKIPEILTYDSNNPLLFNSGLFLFLFLFFSIGYYLLRNTHSVRILYTIAFSCFFYYKTSGWFVFLLLFISVSDFILARLIYNAERKKTRKFFLFCSLLIDLGFLCYFKYTNFFGQMVADMLHQPFQGFNLLLPVGISFYMFQSLSYTIDVYRGQLKPLRKWSEYAFFTTFFPQLTAGPIIRAKDFIPQIQKKLHVSKKMLGIGIFLIVGGLFKKAVISDYISINFVDRIFDAPALYSGLENLMGVYGYALQIYCDFSGYSDMAIGLALLLGFRFNVNFNSPYKSPSITEFWRRWHISLSTWLRDYLYISLGGNRKGKVRMYINLMITMLLGGLWHGASLKFILWGALHGVSLVVHKIYLSIVPNAKIAGTEMRPVMRFLGILFTFHLVCFGWIFFRANSMDSAFEILSRIIFHFNGSVFFDFISGYKYICIMMLLGFILHFVPKSIENKTCRLVIRMPLLLQALLIFLLIAFIVQIKSSEIQPFIYFQF